jgi:uncharacterized protein (DUF1501 family)
MDRRRFIRNAASFVTIPLILNGQAIHVFGGGVFSGIENTNGKILVLIQFDGGNDGLNTLIPLDMYSNLVKVRPQIVLPENKILKLTEKQGLHPAMTEIQNLFSEEQIMFIQNVGYPQPNLSHFRSKEIINSASDSKTMVSSGWLGRYLESLHPGFPENYPNTTNPHPLSITIGSSSLPTCQGELTNMGLVMQNLNTSYHTQNDDTDFPETPYGYELKYIAQIMESTEKYLQVISEAADLSVSRSALWPAANTNSLADKLKVVARLIGGGLSTPVYMVNLGGFDTHSDQVNADEKEKGQHAVLLKYFSQAVNAFLDELKLQGKADDVIGMTFTEFGRRIASNSSNGTDHGEAFPMILFGNRINPVIMGENPVIPEEVKSSANVPMKIDFRSVYASVLFHWFNLDEMQIADILFDEFEIFPILKSTVSNVSESNSNTALKITSVYPNPVYQNAEIRFYSNGDKITLKLYNSEGKVLQNLFNGQTIAGNQSLQFSKNGLPSGKYFLVIQSKSVRNTFPVSIL